MLHADMGFQNQLQTRDSCIAMTAEKGAERHLACCEVSMHNICTTMKQTTEHLDCVASTALISTAVALMQTRWEKRAHELCTSYLCHSLGGGGSAAAYKHCQLNCQLTSSYQTSKAWQS